MPVLSVYRDHGVVPKASRTDNYNKTPIDLSRYQLVRNGDLVVNKMKAWQGSLAVSEHEGIVSPDYLVCAVSPEVLSRYLHYVLRSAPLIGEYSRYAKGIRPQQWRIYWDDLARIRITLPVRQYQRKIVDFLDAETARIDALMAKKRQLIDLIHERALARAYAAIRGGEERGTRKQSGLPWLGSIPSEWPFMTVGEQFEVMLGKMLDQDRVSGGHLKPYLRNTNVQWDRIDTEDLLLMDFPPHEQIRYGVLPGDLLICEGGEPGRAGIWDGKLSEIFYQKALHRARPRGYSTVRWLFYCLRVAVALNVFAVEGNTTTIAHLTGEQLRAHRFPFPERSTQDRLVAELDRQAERDGRLLNLLGKQIGLLAEHRRALITAAVTGEMVVPGQADAAAVDALPGGGQGAYGVVRAATGIGMAG